MCVTSQVGCLIRTSFCFEVISQLHWLEINNIGDLKGSNGLVNIFNASIREIIEVLQRGWQTHAYESICHRKGITGEFNLHLTQKVVQSLPVTDRSIVALNVIGGYQTGTIKKIWDEEETGLCPFCQQPFTVKK